MTPVRTAFIALLVGCSAGAAAQAPLTDAEIVAAIKAGEAKKWTWSSCSTPTYNVTITNSQGMISALASSGKERSRPLTLETVQTSLRTRRIHVEAIPEPTVTGPAHIIAVVVASKKDLTKIVEADGFTSAPTGTSSRAGALQDTKAIASFSIAPVATLLPGDVDVILKFAQNRTARCTFREREIAPLLQ